MSRSARREQPRAAVVEEVALVDRLEPEQRSARRRAAARRPARARGPAAAPRPRAGSRPRRLGGDRLPDVNAKKSPTASTVLSISSSPCASRHEPGLELRRRDVDPAREQVPEQRAVALGVARLRVVEVARPARPARTASASRRPAARGRTARAPRSSRAAAASSRSYTAGSRRRRSTESPAAVASGFPESVPAW